MSKPKSPAALSGRLATLLVEVLNHPKSEAIVADAAHEAYHDSGAEARHAGDLARMLACLGRHVCEAAEGDMTDLCEFYADEAEHADHSDHSPADCEEWSKEYDAACKVYSKSGVAFNKLAADLVDGLRAAGI
jgi:hypothetical protein